MRFEIKYTPDQASEALAANLQPMLKDLILGARFGLDVTREIRVLTEYVESELPHFARLTVVSPLHGVSNEEWLEAREEAARLKWERTGMRGEPNEAETLAVLKGMDQARYA